MATGPKTQTDDYSKFVSSNDNRDAKLRPDLVQRMKSEGFPSVHAITCRKTKGGKLEILRGQHRFLAAQELGIPLWYEVTDDPFDTIADASGTKNWKMDDYVTVFARHGLPDYIELKDFCARHKLSVSSGASLFCAATRGGKQSKAVKNGTFKVESRKTANDVIKLLNAITLICQKVGQSRLVDALLGVSRIDGFSVNAWLKRIDQNRRRIKKCETQDGYLEMLEDVHNFRLPVSQQKNISFLAKKAMNGKTQ